MPRAHEKPYTLCLYSQKGGIGKTAITINLGGQLATLGYKVLLIDLDPHGHLTEGVGLEDLYYPAEETQTLYKALLHGDGAISDLIVMAPHDRFWVIPAAFDMALAERELTTARSREHKLKRFVSTITAEHAYDWILIDSPPQFGNLSDNALNAARHVMVPIEPNYQSVRALNLLLDQLVLFEKGLDVRIEIVGILPNKYLDTTISNEVLAGLQRNVGQLLTPFVIRKRSVLDDAWKQGASVYGYTPQTSYQRKAQAELQADFQQLADYLIEHFEGTFHE